MPPPTIPMFRLAGFLYLVIIVLGVSSTMFLRAPILASGGAEPLAAASGQLRLSIAADAVMVMACAGLAVLLFLILRPVGAGLSLAAMVFRLMQGAVIAVSLLFLIAALEPAFAAQAPALIELHGLGYDLGLAFFGVNSVLTGLLLCRLGGFARVIASGIMLAGLICLAGSVLSLSGSPLAPAFAPAYGLPLLAESAFCLWLLLVGTGASRSVTAA